MANNYLEYKFNDENSFSDDEFKSLTSLTKEQFYELFTFCVPDPNLVRQRHVTKKHLLTFLCKLRQGLSDECLTVMFNYCSRQNTSTVITTVRQSLMKRFVLSNIGFAAITRQQYVERHVTDFANALYNPEPNDRKAVAYIDGTYSKIEKSSNFRILQQSYCVHKGYHLLKPCLIVAPDGYILAILGLYFSDSRNNDAHMLCNDFEHDVSGISNWFLENDIFVVDRGYRDAKPLLERIGIDHKMSALLARDQKQLSTEQSNESRLVTKTRWIVESRNGHIKSIFKFFQDIILTAHLIHLGDFYRIAGAIINRYYPPIHMQGATIEMAQEMLVKRC